MEDTTKLTELLNELENEHQTLLFESFSSDMAWEIGVSLKERAAAGKRKIVIHIVRNNQVLFHYAFDGLRPDNDEWVRRKCAAVCRFYKSSYYVGMYLKNLGMTLDERYHVSEHEYCIQGGGFPLTLHNTGVIGALAVSGMSEEEDHLWAMEAVRAYLKKI
ncbi:MAG: heme-degrading domain-containing protein [Spirochaetales bacterium]|jgi:uncharacterized protein (UPF0303 family)|nr:heme-degrading domain-containing protein [Spirochaetales bacterium]